MLGSLAVTDCPPRQRATYSAVNKGVEESMQNCWLAASRTPPRFESKAAFRSWLLRLLIDLSAGRSQQEPVAILCSPNRR